MTRRFGARALVVLSALVLASCMGDGTGPGNRHFVRFNVIPHFDSRAVHAVAFDRVRVLVTRPGQSANALVDTTVTFPANADTLELPLQLAITGTSEQLEVTMFYLDDPGGVVVFQAGPELFTASLGSNAVTVDVVPVYVGPGANATKVVIVTTPPSVFFGDTVTFTAQALDAGNNVIANTPIVWLSLDPSRATVPDEAVGRVAGQAQRGNANIVASLLVTTLGVTPPADTSALPVAPKPNQIAVQGGSGQSGTVGAQLAQALAFRIRAVDNLGVQGAIVTFSAPAGSVLSQLSDTTDANGDVSVLWTLPTTPGTPQVTATVAGVTGVSTFIGATAVVGAPTQLAFTVQPSSVQAGSAIAPAIQVAARDQFGNPTPGFVASVSVAIGTNPGGATIGGTTTVTAVAGVATFSNVTLSTSGTGYTLVASATGLSSATSGGLNVTAPANLISWINAAGGNWSVGANWSRGTAPVATDTVNISLAGTYTVNVDINATVTRVEVGGASGTQTLQINANNLVVTGTGAIGTSGRITLGGGSLAGAGIIDVAGQFTWTGGTLGGNGGTLRVLNTGSLTVSSNIVRAFVNHTLEQAGSGTWSGLGTINSGQGAVWRILSGATLDIQGDPFLSFNQGGTRTRLEVLAGAALMRTTSAGVAQLGSEVDNDGTVSVSAGTLRLSGGSGAGSSDGSYMAGSTGTLDFSFGTHTLGAGTVSGGGIVSVSGATVNAGGNWALTGATLISGVGALNYSAAGGSVSTIDISGGALGGTVGGLLTVNTGMTWTAGGLTGSGGTVRVAASATLAVSGAANKDMSGYTLEVAGTGTWTGTHIVNSGSAATVRVLAGGSLDIQGAPTIQYTGIGAIPVFDNQGTLLKSGAGTVRIDGTFNSTGTLNISLGDINAFNGGTLGNAVTVSGVAFLGLSGGTFTAAGNTLNVGGSGRVILAGGLLSVPVATDTARFTTLELVSGTLTQNGVVRVATLMDWNSAAGSTTINGSGKVLLPNPASLTITGTAARTFTTGTIEVGGTTTWSGSLQIDAGLSAVFRNLPSGNFILSGNGNFAQTQGFPQAIFDNQGTFARNTSAGTATWGVFYQDTVGTMSVTTGVFALSGGARLGGSKTISAGAVLDLTNGTVLVRPATAFAGTGLLRASGGSLLGPDSASAVAPVTNAVTVNNFDLTGTASLAHEGLFIVNTTMNWTGGTIASNVVGLGGTTRIAGTLNMSMTGAVFLTGAHTIDNQGVVNYSGAGNVNSGLGAVINNAGNWVWSANGQILSNQGAPAMTFVNVGNLQRTTSAATAVLDAVMNKTGGFNIATGSLGLQRGSVTNFAGAVNGTGGLALSGGTFTQTGAMTSAGSVNVSGGTLVMNGFGFGVAGAFSTSATGTLVMINAADSLDINGVAGFSGGTSTLNAGVIRMAGNFIQTGTTSFQGLAQSAAVANRVVFDGATGTQTINFADPVNSFFRRMLLQRGAGTSTVLQTNVRTTFFSMGGGTYSMTGIASPMSRLIADTVAGANSGSVSMQSPLVLVVNAALVDSNVINVDTVVFAGANQNILRTFPGGGAAIYTYRNIRIAQTGGTVATVAWPVLPTLTMTNDLVVSSGTLNLNGRRINVTGNFRTETGGILRMQNAADSLLVAGNATFAGGSTAGQLTAGATGFATNFDQSGGATDAFAPSNTHHTVLGNVGVAQSISFANPTTSFFDVLELPATTHTVTMQTNMLVNDSLIISGGGGAADLVTLGTTQRLRVNGVVSIPAVTASGRLAPAVLEMGGAVAPVIGNIAAPRGMSADTTVYLGAITTLPVGPGIHYNHLRVSTTGPLTMAADTITGDFVSNTTSAQFGFTGTFQTNRFRTQLGGTFSQSVAGNNIVVVDSAIFGGLSTATLLSAGTLTVLGNFVQQGGNAAAYAPSGTHTTNLGNSATASPNSTVFFANPTTSFFNTASMNKNISTPTTVTLLSDARTIGNLTVANATGLRGPGMRMTVGAQLIATVSTFSPTINTLGELELSTAPNVNIAGATADTIVFNGAMTNMPATGFTYSNVRVNTTGTITLPAVTIAGDLDIATGTASIPGNFTINGKLRVRGTGVLAMPVGGSPNVTVGDSAIFTSSNSSTPQTGVLRLLRHFNAAAGAYEPNFTHVTEFGGNVAGGQRVFFSAPGVNTGNSWFGTLQLARPGGAVGLTLTSNVFVTQMLQDTNNTTGINDSIMGPGVVQTVGFSAGGTTTSAFVFNNANLVLNAYTNFATGGLTFRNMDPTSFYLTLNRTTAGGHTVSGVRFETAPTGAGRYFHMNMSAAATYSITFQAPGLLPATGAGISGLYVRNGTPLPTVSWAGTTNP